MQASLVRITDPFRPQVGREVHRISRRTRVDTLLRQHGLIAGRGRRMRRLSNFVVAIGTGPNDYLLENQWARSPADGEVLIIYAVPAGGSALRVLALAAVAVFATPLAMGVLGTTALTAGVGTYALGAGFAIAGSLLVNTLLPLPKAANGSSSTASTNYGIGAVGNQAKLGDVIPVQYGKFRVTPNYAAQPYTEYDSNYQYLYSLYCITQGEIDIAEIRIGDTLIGNYAEVQYEVIQPGGSVTLFPTNVATSSDVSGISLKKPADQGEGDTEWSGPYAVSAAGTKCTQIVIDTGYPGGLYRINDDGKYRTANSQWEFQVQTIDDNGNATGDWQTLYQANEWLDDQTQSLFTTRRFSVAAARYQCRMKRLTPADMDGSVVDAFTWAGLRAFLVEDAANYGNVTMLAVAIKASNNINSSTATQLTVIGTRKLPIWNGSSWSDPVATSSIAWAAADILRNTTYGIGWSDSRMNLATLLELDAIWTSRGDYFNGIFDTKVTIADALTSVLRCGRALAINYAGVIEFIRDQPQTTPTLMLTPDNIVDFQVDYVFPTSATPDYVEVTYTDPTTWAATTVDCALSDSEKNNVSKVTLMGCTDRNHAYREGMYMAADNRDRRNGATATVEMEGYIPRYGDLVPVSHDVPAWGLSGQIRSYDAASHTLTLTEPPQWWDGQNVYIQLRARNGSAQGPYRVIAGSGDFDVVLQGLTDTQVANLYISDGISEDPTNYQLGPGEAYAKKMLVTKAEPQSNGQVQLTLVNYSETVYTAETDADVPPPASGSLLINQPSAPAVGGVGISEDPNTQLVTLYVAAVAGAVAYEFQISYDGGLTWMSVGTSKSNSITVRIPAGTWIVRARAISSLGLSGGWSDPTSVTVTGSPPVIGALLAFSATTQVAGIMLAWQLPSGSSLIGAQAVEIWYGATSSRSAAQLLGSWAIPTNTYTLNNLNAGVVLYFWARIRGTDSGNYGPEIGPVRGSSSTDAQLILSYLTGQITATQLGQDLLSKIDASTEAAAELKAYLNAPAYDATAAYSKDAIISDGGHYYRAISDVPAGNEPPNVTYWEDVGDVSQTAYGLAASIHDVQLNVAAVDAAQQITATKTDGIYAQVNPRGAGDTTWGAGDTDYGVGTITVQSIAASATYSQAKRIDTVQANLGTTTAAVQETSSAVATLKGRVDAAWTVKVEATSDGQYALASIGAGVSNESGTLESQILLLADRLAVLQSLAGGTPQAVFVLQNGQAIFNALLVGDGTITNAKIGSTIKSTEVNSAGLPTWIIDKSGTITINGDEFQIVHSSTGTRMIDTSTGVVVMEDGLLS